VTLVAGVVDREDGAHLAIIRVSREAAAQINRCERRLPVVGVEDQGGRRNPGQREQRGEGEERISMGVVRVVRAALTVETWPVEVLRVLDEEHVREARVTAGHGELVQTGEADLRPDRHLEGIPDRDELEALVADRGVERHDQRRRHSGGRLILRDAGDRLAQTAGARERRQFWRQVNHRHGAAVRRRERRWRQLGRRHRPLRKLQSRTVGGRMLGRSKLRRRTIGAPADGRLADLCQAALEPYSGRNRAVELLPQLTHQRRTARNLEIRSRIGRDSESVNGVDAGDLGPR
jgi:hypothetical protein